MSEYLVLILFEIFVNFIVIVSIIQNEAFNKKKRKKFLLAYVCVEIICLCEYLKIEFVDFNVPDSTLVVIAKLIVWVIYSCTCFVVPIFLSHVFENKACRTLISKELFDLIPLATLSGTCIIISVLFYCGFKSTISATMLFITFVVFWVSFIIKEMYFWNFFEKKFGIVFAVIAVFIILGALIQLITTDIMIYSFSLSIGTLIMYLCYNIGTNEYIDSSTQFLNKKIFKEKVNMSLNNSSKPFRILFLSLEDESYVCIGSKDYINKALMEVFEDFQTIYSKCGSCYRIGAGKFAIIDEDCAYLVNLNKKLKNTLEKQRNEHIKLPFIYYTVLVFDESLNEENVINYACLGAYKI